MNDQIKIIYFKHYCILTISSLLTNGKAGRNATDSLSFPFFSSFRLDYRIIKRILKKFKLKLMSGKDVHLMEVS